MRMRFDLCANVEYSACAVYIRVICMALANCDWLITNTGLTGYTLVIRNMCSCLCCSQAEFKVGELPRSYAILVVVDFGFLYL